ncbi:MAG TPA: hypothetical protein VFC47_12940 [Caulobacteraceae bacterium]|nr:hypothetical protein [Caulobacteraceae bacterium]
MRLSPTLPAVLLCAFLTGCEGAGAPTDPGVCWRAAGGEAGHPGFVAISRDAGSLDDCAAELEAIHLQGRPSADGAFQGYFIFVNAREISSSTGLTTFRYPVFQPSQRKEIDADLRALIKDRNGAAPTAGDISVERK